MLGKPPNFNARNIWRARGYCHGTRSSIFTYGIFGGSVGIIYRQFSVTLVSAMVLSAIVALTLSPALCATLLKPANENISRENFYLVQL